MSNTKQSLVLVAPPSDSIVPGDTSPASIPGATIWSTTVEAPLVWTGTSWQRYSADQAIKIVSVVADRTLLYTDAYKYLRVTSPVDTLITVPNNSTVQFDVGTYITGIQAGTGFVGFASAIGVTLNVASTFMTADYVSTRDRFSPFNLVKVGTNEWDLTGDLINIS